MGVKIDINIPKLQDQIKRTIDTNMGILANEILNDINQYCKEDTGMLIASSFVHSKLNEGHLVWQTPYARRQYYEIKTAYKDVNPNASWKWCEVAKSKHKQEWERKAQRILVMR